MNASGHLTPGHRQFQGIQELAPVERFLKEGQRSFPHVTLYTGAATEPFSVQVKREEGGTPSESGARPRVMIPPLDKTLTF